MRTTAAKVINQCASQEGYREGADNYNKYAPIAGHANHEAWCATFLVAEFKVAGQELPPGADTAGCWENVQAFKRAGRFSVYPAVGAIFFIGDSGDEHTGLVYKYDGSNIYTIEGNTNTDGSANGNGVYKRVRERSSIYGYGYPNYSDAIVSADPKWGGTATPPSTTPPSGGSTVPSIRLTDVQPGDNNSSVLLVQKALKKVYPDFDYSSGPGVFGPRTTAAYARYQRSLGFSGADASGTPGNTSLVALGKQTGLFTVSGATSTPAPSIPSTPSQPSGPTTGSNYETRPEPSMDMTRTTYGGRTVNQRTKVLLQRAAEIYGSPFYLVQGSYNRGGVSASAGTHDGGGVVDVDVSNMNTSQRLNAVQALRKAGFAAWLRTPAEGFSYHIHACAIGDREMAYVAKDQVQSYFNGRNGLVSNARVTDALHWPNWADKYNY